MSDEIAAQLEVWQGRIARRGQCSDARNSDDSGFSEVERGSHFEIAFTGGSPHCQRNGNTNQKGIKSTCIGFFVTSVEGILISTRQYYESYKTST
jgi:hypothetical protein